MLIRDQWIEDQGHHSYPTYPYSCVAANANMADVLYILQLVKSQLIRLYLEVQHVYKKYITREVMTVEGICWTFFQEIVPEAFFVEANRFAMDEKRIGKMVFGGMSVDGMSNEGIGVDRMSVDYNNVGSKDIGGMRVEEVGALYGEKRFEPVMDDIRPPVEGVLPYKDIVGNKSKFAQLEVELFDHELLDMDIRFRKKPHGNVLKMAAVYWVAYRKGYFSKHYFKEKHLIEVTAIDVRLFLNHRYQTDIERQFRNFRNEKLLNSYLESEVWISFIDRY